MGPQGHGPALGLSPQSTPFPPVQLRKGEGRGTGKHKGRWSCGPGSSPRTPPLGVTPPAGRPAPPYLKLLTPREAGELSELQLNARDLGHRAVRGPAGRVGGSGADVHVRVWDPGGRLERRQQPIPKVFLMTRHDEDRGFPSHGSLGSVPRRPPSRPTSATPATPPPVLTPVSGHGTSLASRGLGAQLRRDRGAPRALPHGSRR